jgi:hypothetical protein
MRRLPLIALFALPALLPGDEDKEASAPGFETITEEDVLAHLVQVASPQREGRDTPSEGLTSVGDYLIERLKALGAEPGGHDGGFRHRFTTTPQNPAPAPSSCLLILRPDDGDPKEYVLEEDFVPLPRCAGRAEGPLTFFGFGITEADRKYDDLKGKNCKGEIVMVLESEPRHKRLFEGPDVLTAASNVYTKVKDLEERGAKGVLVVRRPPEVDPKAKVQPPEPAPLGYRYSWASWVGENWSLRGRVNVDIPVLEITPAVASELLGEDVLELADEMDRKGKPVRRERKGVEIEVSSGFQQPGPVPVDNIVAVLPGADPELSKEYVFLGAHYDHIGVDGWGRVGCGADDNGSGTVALLELAEAFATARPARSLVFGWFAGEEDGLLGSEAWCDDPTLPLASFAAMVNMDMLGRCEEDEVTAIGITFVPHFEDVLKDAKKLHETRVKKIVTNKGADLWERSDQAAFWRKGIPALFFTEGSIDADNPDYHRYTDTIENISIGKITRSTRLIFNFAWLVANDPERPPRR